MSVCPGEEVWHSQKNYQTISESPGTRKLLIRQKGTNEDIKIQKYNEKIKIRLLGGNRAHIYMSAVRETSNWQSETGQHRSAKREKAAAPSNHGIQKSTLPALFFVLPTARKTKESITVSKGAARLSHVSCRSPNIHHWVCLKAAAGNLRYSPGLKVLLQTELFPIQVATKMLGGKVMLCILDDRKEQQPQAFQTRDCPTDCNWASEYLKSGSDS